MDRAKQEEHRAACQTPDRNTCPTTSMSATDTSAIPVVAPVTTVTRAGRVVRPPMQADGQYAGLPLERNRVSRGDSEHRDKDEGKTRITRASKHHKFHKLMYSRYGNPGEPRF